MNNQFYVSSAGSGSVASRVAKVGETVVHPPANLEPVVAYGAMHAMIGKVLGGAMGQMSAIETYAAGNLGFN